MAVEENQSSALHPGFSKHTIEMWHCIQMIIKVAGSGDQTTDYIRGVPADSTAMFNEFLVKYGVTKFKAPDEL